MPYNITTSPSKNSLKIARKFSVTRATTTVQSSAAALTDSGKQTTYCLNTRTNIACFSRRKRGWGRDRVAKIARKKGMERHPIPIKKPVSNKQPSLISSNEQKGLVSTQCEPIFLNCRQVCRQGCTQEPWLRRGYT